MFAIKSVTVLFFTFIIVSDCQRRIIDGYEVKVDRTYVVYLVKAPLSKMGYVNWLCGGAIVNSQFVVTSAACIKDVDYIYVIAGYRKYINDADIDSDQCTGTMKKRVAYTCWPKGYELKYGELDYWSFIDIALARVETPFDFNDSDYTRLCSYQPTSIAINYEEKYQKPGTDALVLGWGHIKNWRLSNDTQNYNEPYLRYAPTLILNKTTCMNRYKEYTNMSRVINQYMICSLGKGNIDDSGKPIQVTPIFQNGCTNAQEKLLGFEGVSCEGGYSENENYDDYDDDTRRHGKTKGKTKNKTKSKTRRNPRSKNKTRIFSSSDLDKTNTRRSGICQNDHGGPIVTWAGANEILIGVASVFKVSDEYECMGPYLYTSTTCTGAFLHCILNTDFINETRRSESRRYLCDRPASERGYDTIERTISWEGYPGSHAVKENIERSGPEPNMAPSQNYLTNNNNRPPRPRYAQDTRQQETIKRPSNTMFQADTNPAFAGSAHKERFEIRGRNPEVQSNPVQETIPVNIRQQETMLLSNNEYLANKNPGIEYYARKQMNPENKTVPGEESFPVNDRYSEIDRSHDNKTSPATIKPAPRSEPAKNLQAQASRPHQPL